MPHVDGNGDIFHHGIHLSGGILFTGIYDETVGSGSGHHTPAFDIGEKGLVTGVAAALSFVLAALKEKPKCNSFQPADLESMLKLIE